MHETYVKHSARYRNIGVQDVILSMDQDYDSAMCVVGRCRCVDAMVCENIFIGKIILIFVICFQEGHDRKIRLENFLSKKAILWPVEPAAARMPPLFHITTFSPVIS